MNSAKLVKVLIPMLLISALVIISACAPAAPPGAVIKVGNLFDLSGPGSGSTIPIHEGTIDYFDWVSEEQGGIGGAKVEVLWGDTKSDVATAVTLVNQYIEQGVLCVYGTPVEMVGCRAPLETAKVPAMGVFSAKTLVMPPGPRYSIIEEAGQIFSTTVAWYYSQWKKQNPGRPMRVAIIAWDYASGRAGADGVKRWAEMQPAGVAEVVYEAYPGMTTVDFTPELLGAKAEEPDVVVGVLYGTSFGLMTRDAGKAGLPADIPLLLWTGAFDASSRALAGAEIGRVYCAYSWVLANEDYAASKIAANLAQTIRNSTPAEIGVGYYVGVMQGIISHKAMEMALEEVGYENLDGTAVMEYGLDRMCDVDLGVGTRINFCKESNRVGPVSMRITKWNEQTQIEEDASGWIDLVSLDDLYPEG